jgi:sugar O-acyltransferase (sialic acid O-acetyltransferase NeuD family)
MKLYAVYGACGYGREVMPLLRAQYSSSDVRIVFIDDSLSGQVINNCDVLSYQDFLLEPACFRYVTLAIANYVTREKLDNQCRADGIGFVEIKADNVVRLDDVSIGEGAILNSFVTLTSNIRIGKHFHANIYSYVAHNCVIGDFVTFAPSVKCNGNIVIEDHAYIGAGAIIKQGKPGAPLVIGKGAVVGMGAVVTKSVPPGVTVVGNPARVLEIPKKG